jgi:hypothetical protein
MKRLFLYLLILSVVNKVQAQSTNYANRMNHIFGNIDKSKVTTGYLKEYGIKLTSLEAIIRYWFLVQICNIRIDL